MILLDTNIFLELLLGRERASDCKALLKATSSGVIEATATHFAIHAVEAILRRPEPITSFLRNLERSQGLYIYETSLADEIAAAALSKSIKRDFDDALQYYTAKKQGADAIVSFDRHFDGLDIPRIEPAQALHFRSRRKRAHH